MLMTKRLCSSETLQQDLEPGIFLSLILFLSLLQANFLL
ncbi:hypothetical protein CTL2C_887 [Chlamydia trachomatis L2c]|nr:hypothetical protein CTL2C_887 [Chlamydia trachomatis L2c]